MTWLTHVRALVWRLLMVACIASIATLAMRPRGEDQPYDHSEARQKLLVIGNALRLYRESQELSSPEQWKVPEDAGLPIALTKLLTPGHPWSIESPSVFRVSRPQNNVKDSASHFHQLYWQKQFGETHGLSDITPYLPDRGEQMPVLADFNSIKYDEFLEDPVFQILILRLDGSVSEIEYNAESKTNIWRK